ncbi:MAG: cell wall metabolism sensor histidine kinase WalK [Clostridiales bacterium]|jgi:signal transduction histidine kinase|nr:cell wall metabolism sensor histidine kinase WalK [Clostridiales bacterium]
MAKENKVRVYNRLFFKLYLNYAVMLLMTAVLICMIFIQLYKSTTMKNEQDKLEEQAENSSDLITTKFINTQNYSDFLDYINTQQKIMDSDIWTISNPYAIRPMDLRLETNSFEEFSVEYKEYVDLLESAFQNKTEFSIADDEIYQTQTITVAVPIYGTNREVVGALLSKAPVKGLTDIINDSLSLIVISSVVALAISFIVIIIFATELSLPISRMRHTALSLAAGNYHSKTGIKRNDEIGDLAKTVDILSEKLLENDIQRKNLDQMRLDFFANVSHELRTPITVLRAYTESLIDGVVSDEDKVNQYYDRMLLECKSMERLVGDLMLLSKMQNPDFAIDVEPVNLVQIFDDIIRSADTIAEKRNIKIEIVKNEPVIMILGDYDRLRQMFMIILDNAIKFSDEYKTVHINLSKTDKIRVAIKDEGIGMDSCDLDNIFEKFYKSNLSQNASGTGLGLSIAKQIAIKHEGHIEVESSLGVGSTFTFTFPPFNMDEASL